MNSESRSLREMGLRLPATPPRIGAKTNAGLPQWNGIALKRVLRDHFLPEHAGTRLTGAQIPSFYDRVASSAEEFGLKQRRSDNGEPTILIQLEKVISGLTEADRRIRAEFCAWLGYSEAELWPHKFGDRAPLKEQLRRLDQLGFAARLKIALRVLRGAK